MSSSSSDSSLGSVINNSKTEVFSLDDDSQSNLSFTLTDISSQAHKSQSKKHSKSCESLSSIFTDRLSKDKPCDDTDDFSSSGSEFYLSDDSCKSDTTLSPDSSKSSSNSCDFSSDSSHSCESCKPHDSSCHSSKPDHVPSKASAFIYDGKNVRYNSARGIPYDAPLVVGSRKTKGHKGDKGYNSRYLRYDPKTGDLIQGGNNDVTGRSNNVTVLSSSGVKVKNGENIAFIGVERGRDSREFCGMKRGLVTENLYAMEHLTVGPIPDGVLDDGRFLVNGDAEVRGNLRAKNLRVDSLEAGAAKVIDLQSNSTYIASDGGPVGRTVVLNPSDTYDIIYVNSAGGTLNILLGDSAAEVFRTNQEITFKDVNPEFGAGPSYNTNIIVPEGDVRIEYYSGDALVASPNAGYALNTAGGAVTFRYANFGIPGAFPTWVIVNQFTGNPREAPPPVPPIENATQEMRAQVLNRH